MLLGAILVYFFVSGDIAAYRYVEPFWMFSLQASTGLWIALGVLLVATVFVRNLYCRFLCPLGAALGVLSKLTVFGIKRWSECKTCKICEKACEWGAIRGPKIVMSECVRCDDCERLYMDTKKCPHWLIIIRRKSDAHGASVGDPTTISRSFNPDEMSTSFLSVTITPSTPGSRSMSAIPGPGPSTNTPVARPSASVARPVTIVTLRHPRAGSPLSGSRMW